LQEWEERLDIASKRMTDENRKAFMALANSHTEDGSGPILGIIRTNGYKVPGLYDGHEDDNTRAYTAVLNVMSITGEILELYDRQELRSLQLLA